MTMKASPDCLAMLYVLMGVSQTVWGPVSGALFSTLVPELLRYLASLDPSLKSLESGRFIVFGVAVVLLMVLRPEGLITRTMIERLFRRPAAGAQHG